MAKGSITVMLKPENNDRTILDFAQGGYLSIAVDSFITDRRASELTKHSIKFYQSYLKAFLDYCDSLAVTQIKQINHDFVRKYLLFLEGKWNPCAIHGSFRT